MLKECIELVGSVDVADDIQKKVKTVGVRGLDFEQAKKLGVFTRIANLITVMHATISAAYMIYGDVDYMIDSISSRKNEIAKQMNVFEKAYDKFFSFWTEYYTVEQRTVSNEIEILFHRIMEWAQLPEYWNLGDEQRTNEDDITVAIRIDSEDDDRVYTFRNTSVNVETLESEESWGVLCYDPRTNKQTVENTDMDKASATMVAKRLSCENPQYIYTAAIIHDVKERRTDVTPFKAFRNNKTVGKVLKVQK